MSTSRHSSPRSWGAAETAAAPSAGQAGRVDLIQQSHERCAALGPLRSLAQPDTLWTSTPIFDTKYVCSVWTSRL